MTQEEKIIKYRAGQYLMPPPPHYTGLWNEDDWIRYIDRHGKWK